MTIFNTIAFFNTHLLLSNFPPDSVA